MNYSFSVNRLLWVCVLCEQNTKLLYSIFYDHVLSSGLSTFICWQSVPNLTSNNVTIKLRHFKLVCIYFLFSMLSLLIVTFPKLSIVEPVRVRTHHIPGSSTVFVTLETLPWIFLMGRRLLMGVVVLLGYCEKIWLKYRC